MIEQCKICHQFVVGRCLGSFSTCISKYQGKNALRGLYTKYILKSNGACVDPKAEYFILRLDTDKHAREAVLKYADLIKDTNSLFSDDLIWWVNKIEEKNEEEKLKDVIEFTKGKILAFNNDKDIETLEILLEFKKLKESQREVVNKNEI